MGKPQANETGPVPLKCANCDKTDPVKFLNNTRQWLCRYCYKYKRCLFDENGKKNKCSSYECTNDATCVTSDYWARCDRHPFIY
jgi:hypothetical protein